MSGEQSQPNNNDNNSVALEGLSSLAEISLAVSEGN
jgi:hypothetical protein